MEKKHYRITLNTWASETVLLNSGKKSDKVHMHNSGVTLYSKFETDDDAKSEARDMWKRNAGLMREITIIDSHGLEVLKINNFKEYGVAL